MQMTDIKNENIAINSAHVKKMVRKHLLKPSMHINYIAYSSGPIIVWKTKVQV